METKNKTMRDMMIELMENNTEIILFKGTEEEVTGYIKDVFVDDWMWVKNDIKGLDIFVPIGTTVTIEHDVDYDNEVDEDEAE